MKVQVSSIWMKKKIDLKSGRIRTHCLLNLVYHANQKTTAEIIKVDRASTPTPKKNLTSSETVLNPKQ